MAKSNILSRKHLKRKNRPDFELRESKTPRDHIPKLNAWEAVKEKVVENFKKGTQDEEEKAKLHFDKEKYMKKNCINHKTKLQLDQIQMHESKLSF